jgi:hydrogenase expression/formation protein HypD
MKLETDKIIQEIKNKAAQIGRPLRFMELCGTHSQTIAEHNLKSLMPKNIKLISGPGCPVCVTDQSDIDVAVGLALKGVPIAAYGDSISVPGNVMSLEQARQKGADVTVVYDIQEAVELKKTKPRLVFFGLGFETTVPMTAWAIKKGLAVYSAHKIFPPAMAALLKNAKSLPDPLLSKERGNIEKNFHTDGFIDPGHVSAIIGTEVYQKFKIPQVIAGFESLDVLRAIDLLLDQILAGKKEVENEYFRVVRKNGNTKALKLIEEVFEISDAKWRGLGKIKKSGLRIRKKYQKQDAEFIYKDLIKNIKAKIKTRPSACRCGLVLQGLIEPKECPLFRKVCTPESPQGACMVSVEGSCNVEYRYDRK